MPNEAARLRSAAAVRERCEMVYRFVADGRSPYFTIDASRLDGVADYVAEVTRASLSRSQRFPITAAGVIFPRAASIAGRHWRKACLPIRSSGRAWPSISVTVSVLLDAGAGHAWRYRERGSGLSLTRSEGLAVASLDMFRAGAFSSAPDRPYRVDDAALAQIDAATLAHHFQADGANPLIGIGAAQRASAPSRRRARRAGRSVRMRARTTGQPGRLFCDHRSTTAPSRLRPCWRRCSRALPRSGHRDWCLTALPSAMPAGIAP